MRWDLPSPFVCTDTVGAVHVDRLGHTNNAVYLAWCEHAAWEHSAYVGLGWEQWLALDRAGAVRAASLNFVASAVHKDELEIATWVVANDGRLRARRRFQIVRVDGRQTLFRAELEYVCIEISSGKLRRLPAEFRAAFPVLAEVAAALESEPS